MPADWIWKQGDTQPSATDTLDTDLTGATPKLIIRSLTSTRPLTVSGLVEVTDELSGALRFTPSAQDTQTAGQFMANWRVTFADGSVMTFPTVGYIWISIEENLTSFGGQQLVSLPQVKDYMAGFGTIADRSHDSKLLGFIEAATPLIENIVGPVIVRQFDEWHEGGQYSIRLRRRPSTALGTNPVLTIEGCDEYRGPTKYSLSVIATPAAAGIYSVMLDTATATLYRRTTGGGVIAFGAGAWGGGMPQAVHVIYSAGQQTVPANVAEAACEAVRVNYETTMAVGRGSRTRSDETDTGPPLGFYLPRRALELLAPMRRYSSIA